MTFDEITELVYRLRRNREQDVETDINRYWGTFTVPQYQTKPQQITDTSMKAIKYARFKPETAETYKAISLFNHLCVYPILTETEEDVVIETHPAVGAGHSAKLVIPKSMIDKQDVDVLKLLPPGNYAFSPQFIECQEVTTNNRVWGGTTWPRSKECRPAVRNVYERGSVSHAICAVVAMGGNNDEWGCPSHWFISADAADEESDGPKKKPKTDKTRRPKATDINKLVRYTSGDLIGRVFAVHAWDQFRGRFHLYNGHEEKKAAATELELLDDNCGLKSKQYVTQSKRWLDRGSSGCGATGHEFDHKPCIMMFIAAASYGQVSIHVLQATGEGKKATKCFWDDIRPLTPEEEEGVKRMLNGEGRDEAWVRAATPKPVSRLIDVAPTSPFTPALITSNLGIILKDAHTTSAEIWAELASRAKEIKMEDSDYMWLERIPVKNAVVTTGTAPDAQPEPVRVETIPEVPVATEHETRHAAFATVAATAQVDFDEEDDDDNT